MDEQTIIGALTALILALSGYITKLLVSNNKKKNGHKDMRDFYDAHNLIKLIREDATKIKEKVDNMYMRVEHIESQTEEHERRSEGYSTTLESIHEKLKDVKELLKW